MKKILIIDDDADLVNLVENRLGRNNYTVISAHDGDEGVKKAIQEKPDLIIMDVMMPKMSGGEAVKLLKTYDPTKNIPILFFTAMISYSPNSTELEKINVNGQFYPALTKPFEPKKLLSAVQELLDE